MKQQEPTSNLKWLLSHDALWSKLTWVGDTQLEVQGKGLNPNNLSAQSLRFHYSRAYTITPSSGAKSSPAQTPHRASSKWPCALSSLLLSNEGNRSTWRMSAFCPWEKILRFTQSVLFRESKQQESFLKHFNFWCKKYWVFFSFFAKVKLII